MAIPFLNHLDLTDVSQLQNALLHKTTSGVASAVEAKIIYDTGSNTIKYYDGTQWIELGGDTDNYVDGMSLSGNTLTLTRTGSLADLTQDLSGLGFVDGSGTQNYVAKWTPDGDTLGNSIIFDNGSQVGIGTTAVSTFKLTVDGPLKVNDNVNITRDTIATIYLNTTSSSTDNYAVQNSGGTFQIKNNSDNQLVFQLLNSGQAKFNLYGQNTFTGTAAYNLSVDSSGNIIETAAAVTTDVLQGNSADSANSERYITFVDNATGAQQAKTDANFRFNPSTDTLSVTNLVVSGDTTYHNETIQIVENNTISFEGTTADAHEVHLTSADATADRTQTLQDASGTIALTSDITGTNSGTNTGDQNLFSTIAVSGQSNVVADSTSDTLTLVGGSNVTITTAAGSDTVTIASTDTNTQLATAAALVDVSAMASNDTASFTHGLGSQNLIVQLYDTTSGLVVHADVDHTSTNAISITFAATGTALASAGIGDIRVVVIDAKHGLTDKTVSYS